MTISSFLKYLPQNYTKKAEWQNILLIICLACGNNHSFDTAGLLPETVMAGK